MPILSVLCLPTSAKHCFVSDCAIIPIPLMCGHASRAVCCIFCSHGVMLFRYYVEVYGFFQISEADLNFDSAVVGCLSG